MKRVICTILIIGLVFSFLGCKKKKPNPSEPPEGNSTPSSSVNTQDDFYKTMVAVSVPTVTDYTTHEDGTVLSKYTYQSMSLVLHKPQVADKIILDFLNRVDSTGASAKEIANQAKSTYNGDKNWVPYLYYITYNPTRIDHKVLSLFGNNVVFSGAGHPERTCASASYDLLTGDVLTLASIIHKDATTDQLCALVLDGLSKMAEGNYLYKDYAKTVKQRFETDASVDEAWYFTQNGLCFYFAPYEIAPYSSGVIIVEIPYEKLSNILHEAYLPSVRPETSATLTIAPFESTNLTEFSHIAELVMDKNAKMYMVKADNIAQDVRIILSDNTSSYTVFAAYNLAAGDGIMVQAGDDIIKDMRLTYKKGKETVSKPLIG